MGNNTEARLCVTCESASGGDFLVELYDGGDCLLERRRVTAFQKTAFAVKGGREYRVRAVACAGQRETSPRAASAWVMPAPGGQCSRCFLFRSCAPPPLVSVDFLLHDAHYPELPLSKGVLTLWPSIS